MAQVARVQEEKRNQEEEENIENDLENAKEQNLL